ncbi:hypothetical protein MMC25_004025 [Agyrium rufum]|nr:hypothetical protein [Agyrium rufum]
MNDAGMAQISPLAVTLPRLPEGEVLSESQWRTLMAIGDTVIPSIHEATSESTSQDTFALSEKEYNKVSSNIRSALPTSSSPKLLQTYLAENASGNEGAREFIQRTLSCYVRPAQRKGMGVILNALDTTAGSLLLTGSSTPIYKQSLAARQSILLSWSKSYLPPLQASFKAFTALFKVVWTKTSPTLGPILDYPRAPKHGMPGKGFDYNFLQFPASSSDEPETVETDVVIIGSGCGAGVCAKNIAEAGHRVLVVEKAYHFDPKYLPMSERDAGIHLFNNGGNDGSDDGSIFVVSASAFGGGGTINWSASLQPQAQVRAEWAEKDGLPFFQSAEFQTSLDRICQRMGVSDKHIEHNATNRVLVEGAWKLGLNAKAVPQNTGGVKHYDGYCTLGCGAAEKQGPVVSFLPDAAKAGAKFIEGFNAEQIVFEDVNGKKTAVGVKGTWISRDGKGEVEGDDVVRRQVIVRAKRVIVSCGTIQSPLLLTRSGLTNWHIGRNLHLHPGKQILSTMLNFSLTISSPSVSFVAATFPEPTNPWEGGILTAVVDSLQDLDLAFHGVKLEATTMLPSWFLPFTPWTSGADFKLRAAKFRSMSGWIALARDRDTGRVYPDPNDGGARIAYTPSAFDKKHILQGMLALAKMAYVQGATEIFSAVGSLRPFVKPALAEGEEAEERSITDSDFKAWLGEFEKKGLPAGEAVFASAHQMGTCRMARSEKEGVVDQTGKVFGIEGLYISDASVFPSASGVNPMVTNMGISDWVSRRIAKGLDGERSGN